MAFINARNCLLSYTLSPQENQVPPGSLRSRVGMTGVLGIGESTGAGSPCITTTSAAPRFTMFEARAPCAAYCAVPPMTVPLSVSISNSSVPLFTKTVLKFSADDPLGVIFIVPVQLDNSV